eukprot:TRINITY_DN31705_c0_g1_i1.p1 TRINITY_DN31705_c0_g1~~TRINITY_DN31705_c0_g1_i1.p1  ORF type:complete len:717 (+),score=182.69 TRINITY_DN31705_c0_g1_i1:89-2239(+)
MHSATADRETSLPAGSQFDWGAPAAGSLLLAEGLFDVVARDRTDRADEAAGGESPRKSRLLFVETSELSTILATISESKDAGFGCIEPDSAAAVAAVASPKVCKEQFLAALNVALCIVGPRAFNAAVRALTGLVKSQPGHCRCGSGLHAGLCTCRPRFAVLPGRLLARPATCPPTLADPSVLLQKASPLQSRMITPPQPLEEHLMVTPSGASQPHSRKSVEFSQSSACIFSVETLFGKRAVSDDSASPPGTRSSSKTPNRGATQRKPRRSLTVTPLHARTPLVSPARTQMDATGSSPWDLDDLAPEGNASSSNEEFIPARPQSVAQLNRFKTTQPSPAHSARKRTKKLTTRLYQSKFASEGVLCPLLSPDIDDAASDCGGNNFASEGCLNLHDAGPPSRNGSLLRAAPSAPRLSAASSLDGRVATLLSEPEPEIVEEVNSAWYMPEETCIFFDWDDTLCPTTFIKADSRLHWSEKAPCFGDEPGMLLDEQQPDGPTMAEVLNNHVKVAEKVLRSAAELGKVVLVTLGQKGWVETSSENFLPGLLDVIQELCIKVVYARESLKKWQLRTATFDRLDILRLMKQISMQKELKRHYKRRPNPSWKNVLSIGDSEVEQEALIEAIFRRIQHDKNGDVATCHCKTVLLPDEPSLVQLTVELEVLNVWLDTLVGYDGHVALDLSSTADTMALLEEMKDSEANTIEEAEEMIMQRQTTRESDA